MQLDADSKSNAVFQEEIILEKLIDEIQDGSLEEEEAKDGKPNFPKLPPKRDAPKIGKNQPIQTEIPLGHNAYMAAERERRIGQKGLLSSWNSYRARMTSHTRNR